MFDVRFLPNPHYEPKLRPLTGERPDRSSSSSTATASSTRFYERLHPLLDYLLPQYLAEGKAHLVVGDRLHRRPASLGRDRPAPRRALRAPTRRTSRVSHRDVTRPA